MLSFVRRTSAKQLVVGSPGLRGFRFRGLVVGSTSRNVIEWAPCLVMVVLAARDVV
ncbi:universal stress protein [Micromonospora alfalfae]|uniref:universal stress protein n=1 Tax=Micromonospora alfalfae TaxID=2911212 RepID=UPI0035587320